MKSPAGLTISDLLAIAVLAYLVACGIAFNLFLFSDITTEYLGCHNVTPSECQQQVTHSILK